MRHITAQAALLAALVFLHFSASAETLLERALGQLDSVTSVQKLESDNFSEKYLLTVTRPVNPEAAGEMSPDLQTYVQYLDPKKRCADAGSFSQRVVVCHVGFDRPTVIVTEGYDAAYALRPGYREELSRLLDANTVTVEYRYFGESVPQDADWDYLTVGNSLSDLHHTVEMLRNVYRGKWISTGISKGGQTTMFYRTYYPDDVDISVPYVAPLNMGVEDGRHEPFLADIVGTEADRKLIADFMSRLLRDRETFLPMFRSHCAQKGYRFASDLDEIYDLSVLELRYALWQYGTPLDRIPGEDASDEEAFRFLMNICEPDYFSLDTPYYAFNVMAVKELGYYGYDMEPFREWMSIDTAEGYLSRIMLTGQESSMRFDPTLYHRTVSFLEEEDPRMIFIYGGYDPWGASGVATWLDTSGKENLRTYVKEGGSHSTRIGSFDEDTRSEIMNRLEGWLAD